MTTKTQRLFPLVIALLGVVLLNSACLKTRAQLRQDGDSSDSSESTRESTNDGHSPMPAQVKEVKHEGGYVIDELKSELTRMNGRIEELERSGKQNEATAAQSKTEEMKKLENRMTELEQAQVKMIEEIHKLKSQAPAVESVDLFQKGKDHYNSGDFESAIESFNGYLKAPHAKYAEEATFLRGESYYGSKQYKKAIIDFSKFPEKYTKSKAMAQALYKIGQSFEALSMKEDAKGFYQELVEKFPKSPEAKKVKGKLK